MDASARLRVEEIEPRFMPSASPLDVLNALGQIRANTETLRFLSDQKMVQNPFTRSHIGEILTAVRASNLEAADTLRSFISDTMNQQPLPGPEYVESMAQLGGMINEGIMSVGLADRYATVLNVSLALPTPVIPGTNHGLNGNNNNGGDGGTTIDLSSDSGMRNTKPSIVGFTDIGNGVKIKDIQLGQGAAATSNSTVSLYYTGWLNANGTQFDSARSPEPPASFDLDGTVDGFQAGVAGMKPGGIRQIFIPSAQAYGNAGHGSVPPNADLVFEVKLISTGA